MMISRWTPSALVELVDKTSTKVSTGVRLTHIPTGIVVASTVDRTQYGNRDRAMKMLQAKLYQLEQEKKAAEVDSLKGIKRNHLGSQIPLLCFTLTPWLRITGPTTK